MTSHDRPYPGVDPPHPDPVSGASSGDEAVTVDAPAPPPTCAVCGCELDPAQTYCLECGSPTPLAPKMRRGAGGLASVAIGLAILGAGAGALAYVASNDDGGPGAVPMVSTAPVITVPTTAIPTTSTDSSLPGDAMGTLPTDTSGLLPGTTATTGGLPVDTTATTGGSGVLTVTGPGVDGQTTSELPTTSDSTGSAGSGSSATGSDDWPSGTSGWTAIVSSIRNEAAARSAASKLRSSGQPGGVLFSTDHPSLRPGYWVVFSGVFTTKSEALSQARSLVGSYPGSYPREITS